jgi:G:T/U-mismatch repair DNA glycosylase
MDPKPPVMKVKEKKKYKTKKEKERKVEKVEEVKLQKLTTMGQAMVEHKLSQSKQKNLMEIM